MKLTDVLDYVVTRYSHLLEIPEAIYGIFPTIYNYCATKFDVVYNTPKCVHCIADDLFAMLKREARRGDRRLQADQAVHLQLPRHFHSA